jgi:hypothetical protein
VKIPGHDVAHKWSFHEKPWRHYQCDGKRETPSGLKIASVTQILGVLDKSALVAWAANVSIQGCWTIAGQKGYRRPRDLVKTKKDGTEYIVPGWRVLQGKLKAAGLDHNSVRDEAAFRGTSIHTLHEEWVRDGKMPNPLDFPEAWRGYVGAYAKWLLMMSGRGARFESVEQIVGSATYGFAGSCDTVAIIERGDGKRERWDFKTSKQVYARTNFRQLAGYELADVEMGNEPTDEQWIAVLRQNGDLVTARSTEGPESFLEVLAVWRRDQPLIKLDDAAYNARRKG